MHRVIRVCFPCLDRGKITYPLANSRVILIPGSRAMCWIWKGYWSQSTSHQKEPSTSLWYSVFLRRLNMVHGMVLKFMESLYNITEWSIFTGDLLHAWYIFYKHDFRRKTFHEILKSIQEINPFVFVLPSGLLFCKWLTRCASAKEPGMIVTSSDMGQQIIWSEFSNVPLLEMDPGYVAFKCCFGVRIGIQSEHDLKARFLESPATPATTGKEIKYFDWHDIYFKNPRVGGDTLAQIILHNAKAGTTRIDVRGNGLSMSEPVHPCLLSAFPGLTRIAHPCRKPHLHSLPGDGARAIWRSRKHSL